MAKVKFTEVGRGKKTWEEEIADPSQDFLEAAVMMSGALMSRDITCEDGVIYAGLRAVGRYEIAKAPLKEYFPPMFTNPSPDDFPKGTP